MASRTVARKTAGFNQLFYSLDDIAQHSAFPLRNAEISQRTGVVDRTDERAGGDGD